MQQAGGHAELLGLLQLGQTLRLLGHRITNQFIDQQVNSGARQLFTDLLHLTRQHPLLVFANQAVDLGRVWTGLLHQHLAAQQALARAALQGRFAQRLNAQRNTQQARPHGHGPAPLEFIHRRQVIGHQTEGAARQTLAVLLGAHLVDQVQGADAEQGDQHQHAQHAGIDAQEDRIHSGGCQGFVRKPRCCATRRAGPIVARCCVIRRSFGMTKLLSSCLAPHNNRLRRGHGQTLTSPLALRQPRRRTGSPCCARS